MIHPLKTYFLLLFYRYVASIDYNQLAGTAETESTLKTTCVEVIKNGSRILNPCGLIANSLFTGKN